MFLYTLSFFPQTLFLSLPLLFGSPCLCQSLFLFISVPLSSSVCLFPLLVSPPSVLCIMISNCLSLCLTLSSSPHSLPPPLPPPINTDLEVPGSLKIHITDYESHRIMAPWLSPSLFLFLSFPPSFSFLLDSSRQWPFLFHDNNNDSNILPTKLGRGVVVDKDLGWVPPPTHTHTHIHHCHPLKH